MASVSGGSVSPNREDRPWVIWALAHHLLAGVRHLLSDFDVGSPLRLARRSAWFVNLGGALVATFAAGAML